MPYIFGRAALWTADKMIEMIESKIGDQLCSHCEHFENFETREPEWKLGLLGGGGG